MGALRTWFTVTGGINRRFYILSGIGLMLFKFTFDNLALWLLNGHTFSPQSYLLPLIELKKHLFDSTPVAVQLAFVIWSLPFAFIGGNLSMRRAHDAGLSRAWGLLFFIPFLNFLAMLALSIIPGKIEASQKNDQSTGQVSVGGKIQIRDLVNAIVVWHVVTAAMLSMSVYGLKSYGAALFLGAPFVAGFAASRSLSRSGTYTKTQLLKVVALANFITAGLFISFAIEGIICITMAAPLAFVAAAAGALMARQASAGAGKAVAMMALALPLMAFAEAPHLKESSRPVRTSIIVDAPPERVWPNVVGFSEIKVPRPWYFRSGIAMPLRARIYGEGVGAVRHCEFTTGSFIEPITAWEPPHRLAFSVESQPPTMEEWSPYSQIAPPHLEDSVLKSQRGEFLLEALAGGKTRLTGTTWYDFDMAPNWYWTLWSDAIIHKIHDRVLRHVANLSEREQTSDT